MPVIRGSPEIKFPAVQFSEWIAAPLDDKIARAGAQDTSMSDASAQESDRPAKARVFISYSRKDIDFADRLVKGPF